MIGGNVLLHGSCLVGVAAAVRFGMETGARSNGPGISVSPIRGNVCGNPALDCSGISFFVIDGPSRAELQN